MPRRKMPQVAIQPTNATESQPDTKKKIFLIMGRTSSGKSEITRGVCEELGLTQVVSYTTRPMRDNEKKHPDHLDHHFITSDEVDQYRDQMAAYTKIGDYEYFTTYDDLDKSDCYVIDPLGAEDLMKNCGDRYDFVTIYIRRPRSEMMKSYNARGQKGNSFRERYDAEDEQFSAYEKAGTWDYHVLNIDSLDEAIAKLQRIIIKEMLKLPEAHKE